MVLKRVWWIFAVSEYAKLVLGEDEQGLTSILVTAIRAEYETIKEHLEIEQRIVSGELSLQEQEDYGI